MKVKHAHIRASNKMTLALLRLLVVLLVLSASTRLARVILLDALRISVIDMSELKY